LTQLQQKDLVTLAPTGSGKTLTFWIPLLFNEEGITIVVTPLVVLGDKNVAELSAVLIPAINLTTLSASDDTFKVALYCMGSLCVEMLDPLHSYYDILRILRFDGNPPPPPFMVFCNDQRETERL
jgi:hypothetical protein